MKFLFLLIVIICRLNADFDIIAKLPRGSSAAYQHYKKEKGRERSPSLHLFLPSSSELAVPCLPELLPPSPVTAAPTPRARRALARRFLHCSVLLAPSREPWFSSVHSPHSLPQCRHVQDPHCQPLPVPRPSRALA